MKCAPGLRPLERVKMYGKLVEEERNNDDDHCSGRVENWEGRVRVSSYEMLSCC